MKNKPTPPKEYDVAAEIFSTHMKGKGKNINLTNATYIVTKGLDREKILRYLKEMFGIKE